MQPTTYHPDDNLSKLLATPSDQDRGLTGQALVGHKEVS